MAELDVLVVHPDPSTVLALAHTLRQERPHWNVRAAHSVEVLESWIRLVSLDVVIVCGGARVEEYTPDAILKWLRSLGQSGKCLGSTCTGSHALAAASASFVFVSNLIFIELSFLQVY